MHELQVQLRVHSMKAQQEAATLEATILAKRAELAKLHNPDKLAALLKKSAKAFGLEDRRDTLRREQLRTELDELLAKRLELEPRIADETIAECEATLSELNAKLSKLDLENAQDLFESARAVLAASGARDASFIAAASKNFDLRLAQLDAIDDKVRALQLQGDRASLRLQAARVVVTVYSEPNRLNERIAHENGLRYRLGFATIEPERPPARVERVYM